MAWMLDTNAVSDLLNGEPGVQQRLAGTHVGEVYLSAVTAGELNYGLAKRPGKARLHEAVRQLLLHMQVADWTVGVAETYGQLRSELEAKGRTLAALDTMIAAHAKHLNLTLVSNDKALQQIPDLAVEDWRR